MTQTQRSHKNMDQIDINVGIARINHPPNHHFYGWYKPSSMDGLSHCYTHITGEVAALLWVVPGVSSYVQLGFASCARKHWVLRNLPKTEQRQIASLAQIEIFFGEWCIGCMVN